MLCPLLDCLGVLGPCYFVGDVDTKELEALNLLHYSSVDENGDVLGPLFPVVHNHLLCLDHIEGEVVGLAPRGQVSDLLPICCLVIVGDQAYHCCVIGKLNDCVGVMPGLEQGLPPLPPGSGPSVGPGSMLPSEVFSPRVLSLLMSFVCVSVRGVIGSVFCHSWGHYVIAKFRS